MLNAMGTPSSHAQRGRSLLVWLAVTVVAACLGWWARPDLPDYGASFEDALTAFSSAVLIGSLVWLWLITTLVIAASLRGRSDVAGVPRWARRLVLLACGVAVLGAALPAQASPDHEPHWAAREPSALAGLPMPDRAIGGAGLPHSTEPPSVQQPAGLTPHVVRPDESLWSIAATHLPDSATERDIAELSQEIYRVNRPVIGADPDLITPGQTLMVPQPVALR